MVYIDTSALAKWYTNEDKSDEFAEWIQTEPEAHISTLTVVEMRCLLARRRRNKDFSGDIEYQVFETFQNDIHQGFLIRHPVDEESLLEALTVLTATQGFALRTLDALHLAIAKRKKLLRIATADRVMIDVANHLGFEVVCFD